MNLNLKLEAADPVHVQIEGFLRRKIETDELGDGFRLPPTSQLAKLWHVDCTAIQRGLAPLVAQGLIERQRGRGTFVRHAGRRATIALLFGPSLADESAHYYRAVLRALRLALQEYGWDCRLYDGLNARTQPDQKHLDVTLDHLKRDMLNYGFKGQLHVALRSEVGQMLREACRVPIVTLDKEVTPGVDALARHASRFLVKRGRRRMAYLAFSGSHPVRAEVLESVRQAIHAQGASAAEIIVIPLGVSGDGREKKTQQRVAELIDAWRLRPDGLPDGLIVSDDIMMRGVALALLAAGIDVPVDIEIVVQSNEGVALHYGVPVSHFEVPIGQIGREGVALLWKAVLREPLPARPVMVHGTVLEQSEFPEQSEEASSRQTNIKEMVS